MAVVGIPFRIPNIVLLLAFVIGIESWIGSVAGILTTIFQFNFGYKIVQIVFSAMVLCRHKVSQTKFVVGSILAGFMHVYNITF